MQRIITLIIIACCSLWYGGIKLQAQSANGTVVNGYYIIEDFNGTAPTFSTTGSSCVIETYPVAGRGQSVKLSVTSSSGYFTIPVTLPSGIVLSNNDSLLIDLYHQSGTFKRLRVHLGSTHANSSTVAHDYGSNFLGGTVPSNRGTVRVGINQLTGNATAGNSFRLGFGIDNTTTVVYIDNIKLKYTLTTAPTSTAADDVTATSFNANWEALFGVENYRLDVATDAAFTNMVSGYNNLNVGNVLTYQITGLSENTTYYYRVRGAKSNGTSPSSSSITVLTPTSGPVNPYVAPNLDPVDETDPTPATIAVPTIFVVDDFESYSIDAALSVNAPGFTTATVKANPTNGSQKSGYVRVTNWDGYLRLNVQLPVGKVLSDYVKLSFDEYLQSGYDQNYKDIRVFFDGVQQFNVASGGTTTNAWTTREFNLAGKSAGNTFVLDIGMRTPNGSYFIDNIKLSPAPAPTATTATAATHINATSFKAQWSIFEGSTSYYLDVATNITFTNMVSGYNNLNVGNVTNYVVTGLAPNTTYYYRVRGSNTSTNSNTITVATKPNTLATSHFATRASGNISDPTIWQSSLNNTGWMSATATPTGDAKSIRILAGHEITIDDDVVLENLIIRPGGKITVEEGKNLSINGNIYLESNANDGMATLVDLNNTTPQSHPAIVKHTLAGGRNWYSALPMVGQTVPAGETFYFYDETGANTGFSAPATAYWTAATAGTPLDPTRGYIMQPANNTTWDFEGNLITGDKQIELTRTTTAAKPGFNLIANPYPSYLDWDMVVIENTDNKVWSTVWYRTKTSADSYTFDTYNASLQVATENGVNTVTGLIPPMQSFWVRVKNTHETATLNLNNGMRKHKDIGTNRLKIKTQTTMPVYRIKLIDDLQNVDETLICFHPLAQNDVDNYDSPKMSSETANSSDIYVLLENQKMAINGLPAPDDDMALTLGLRAANAGNYKIKLAENSRISSEHSLWLEDKETRLLHDMSVISEYTFHSEQQISEDRFVLHFKAPSISTANANSNKHSKLMVYNIDKNDISISMSGIHESAEISIFNSLGQNIGKTTLRNQQKNVVSLPASGIFVVQAKVGANYYTQKLKR